MLSDEAKVRLTVEARNATGKVFGDLDRALGGLKTKALALGAALGAGLGLRQIARDTRRWGDELDTLMDTLGVSADEAGRLNAMARILGIGTDNLAQSFTIFGGKVLDAVQSAGKGTSALEKYGIAFKDANGHVLPFMEILTNVRKQVGAMPDHYVKAAIAQELFGRGARGLHDLLELTDEEMGQLDSRTRNMARLMAGEGVAGMERMTRAQNSLALGAEGLRIAAGVPLFEAFDGLINRLADLAFEWMPRVQAATRALVQTMQVLWQFASTVGLTFATLARRIAEATGFMRLFSGIGKAAGEVIRGFLGLIKEATARVDGFRKAIDEQGLTGAMRGMFEGLPGPMQTFAAAITTAFDGIRAALSGDFRDAVVKFRESWSQIDDALGEAEASLGKFDPATQFTTAFVAAGTAISVAITGWNIGRLLGGVLLRAGLIVAGIIGGWPVLVAAGLLALAATIALNWDQIAAWLGQNAGRLSQWIRDSVPVWLQKIGELWNAFTGWISGTAWPALVQFFTTGVPAFANWIVDSIPTWLGNLGALLGNVLQWLIGTFLPELVVFFVTKAMPTLWSWITEGIPNLLIELGKLVGQVTHFLLFRLLPALVGGAFELGKEMVAGIMRGIGDLGGRIWDMVMDAVENAKRAVGNLFGGGNRRPPTPSDIQGLATGGIVRARPGGTIVRLGEGGEDELVAPLSRIGRGGSSAPVVNVYVSGSVLAERDLARFVRESLVENFRMTKQFV